MSTSGESGIIEAKDEGAVIPVDEKMLIDAIRQVVQEEIRQNNITLRTEMSDMMDIKLAGSEARMDTKLAGLEARMDEKLAATRHEIMEGFNAVIEEKVFKEIRLIAEQHGDLVRKQQGFEQVDERTADLEDRVQVLEVAIKKHTDEIQELQRA